MKVTGTLLDERSILRKLEDRLAEERRDKLTFSVLTILLTPVFVALAIGALVFAAAMADLPVVDHWGFERSFKVGASLTFLFFFVCFFARPKGRGSKGDLPWVGAAVAVLALALALAWMTPLPEARPGLFWSLFVGLGLLMLGLLGHAYEPRDDYYLGWVWGPFWLDDFTTTEDDLDRGHFALGFAVAFPRLIIGSYAEIFGSTWLLRGLDERERAVAAALLHRLGDGRPREAKDLLESLGRAREAHVVRALAKLGLVRPGREHLRLSLDGEKLTGVCPWV